LITSGIFYFLLNKPKTENFEKKKKKKKSFLVCYKIL
ncbi:unnamed protein product, partial [Staurois parvus]